MPDFVYKLSTNGKWIEAMRYAHAFGIMDKRELTDLLKAYLENTEKAVKDIVKEGGDSGSPLHNSTSRLIGAIITTIRVVKEYNLEDLFPLNDLQNRLNILKRVEEIRKNAADQERMKAKKKAAADKAKKKAAVDKAGKDAGVDRTEKKVAAFTPEKKNKETTPENEKKAAEANSDKKNVATEKERLKRPCSSESVSGNVEFFGTEDPAELGLYRLSQRVKYNSEWEMNSTAGDKEKVPQNAGLFQSNHWIYRDDHYQSSYHGDSRSALHPSMYGSDHTGAFATQSPTVTQNNERRGSDGYPSAFGYSYVKPVGPSFYGTSAMTGALAVASAQVNNDGRGLQSYTPTFGGVNKSLRGSSMYDIGAVANSSGGLLQSNYERRDPESNTSTCGGDNLSNISRSAMQPLMSGSGHAGAFATPSPTVTQNNERRGSDGYPPAFGYSNVNPVGPSFYGTSAMTGALAVLSAQVNNDGRGLQSSTLTFGGVDKSLLGSSIYDIGAVANSSGGLLHSDYERRDPKSNTSTCGGDNLSNISRSAPQPSMYGSCHTGAFATPSPTVTQNNDRRCSDGYPSAFGYSNVNSVGPSFYGTSVMTGALAVSSAQVNYDGRNLQSYTPTFGGVDKSSLESSMYDIGAVANSSGSLLQSNYESRGPESNTSTFGGGNLSNISSSMYGSNWSSDPNNWNDKSCFEQYILNLGPDNLRSSDSLVDGSGASAVPLSNVYGSGLEQLNSGSASIRSDYGSVASAAGVSRRSAINWYQFNSGLRS